MDTTQKSCYTYRRRVPFEKLTLADDFLFCKVMQNEKLCKELLEIILHVKSTKSNTPSHKKSSMMLLMRKVFVWMSMYRMISIPYMTSRCRHLIRRNCQNAVVITIPALIKAKLPKGNRITSYGKRMSFSSVPRFV